MALHRLHCGHVQMLLEVQEAQLLHPLLPWLTAHGPVLLPHHHTAISLLHPTRAKSSYPSQTGSTDQVNHIDWANLSQEDKDEFFGWLDEFFSRYLDIALPSRRSSTGMKGSPAVTVRSAGPPPVNLNSRPS
ncbi:hypothetical protein EDB19DRAFT_574000 [Suillus lakei]|nr:hypothetical protein EDB19DRAFT_574000 [Suillus lakei]